MSSPTVSRFRTYLRSLSVFGWIATVTAFVSFILLLLVSLGPPHSKQSTLLNAYTPEGRLLRAGSFGIMVDDMSSSASRGYRIAEKYAEVIGQSGGWTGKFRYGLSKAMVLHPLAASLTFLAIVAHLVPSVISTVLATVNLAVALILTISVFTTNMILFTEVRDSMNEWYGNGPVDAIRGRAPDAHLGAGIWLVLTSMILLVLAVACSVFETIRQRRYKPVLTAERQE